MRTSVRDLVQASHVCRHWRDTIVSSPCLWTEFECKDLELTRQHLERSRPFPINVTASSDSDVQAVLALKSETERFKSLSLHLPLAPLSIVLNQLTDPAPTLEYFCISVDSCGISIPAKFLGGSTPALKSLQLLRISSQLNFSEFPALTRLSLITSPGFDMSELLQLFASAQFLEEVSVEFCGHPTPISESQVVVQLPRMKSLRFSNRFAEFPKRLLFFLDTPFVDKVELDIKLGMSETRTMRDFLPPQLLHLKVDSMELSVAGVCYDVRFRGPGGEVFIRTVFNDGQGAGGVTQSRWFDSFEPMLTADVKDLTLDRYVPTQDFDHPSVLRLLMTMDGVRSFIVILCDNTSIIEALSPPEEGRNILFPHLESLAFKKTIYTLSGLRKMVRAREKSGFRISKVFHDQHVHPYRHPTACKAKIMHLRAARLSRLRKPAEVSSQSIPTVKILSISGIIVEFTLLF